MTGKLIWCLIQQYRMTVIVLSRMTERDTDHQILLYPGTAATYCPKRSDREIDLYFLV